MSHVKKLPSLPPFFRSLKSHNNRKKFLPCCRLLLLRQTAQRLVLDQLTGPSVRCPAERAFLGGLCALCQDSQLQLQNIKHARHGTDTIRSKMGPTWALICSTALLLVLLSSASEGWYTTFCCFQLEIHAGNSCLLHGRLPSSMFDRSCCSGSVYFAVIWCQVAFYTKQSALSTLIQVLHFRHVSRVFL